MTLPPGGVNLTAFESRFQNTWVSRGASASSRCSSAVQLDGELDLPVRDLLFDRGQGVLDHLAGVGLAAVELQLAAGDARQVEQVVDQPRLQLHVAPDHGELAHVPREARVGFQAGDDGEHRRQRRAQLVAQSGEELVLGRVGRLRLLVGPLELLLGVLAVADVDRAADDTHGPALGVAHDEPLVPGVNVAPVAVAHPVLDAEGGVAPLDGAVDLLLDPVDVLGVDLRAPPLQLREDLLRPVSQEAQEAQGALDGAGFERPVVDQAADRFGGQAEALLALAQGRLVALHLGDVGRHAPHEEPAGLVAHGEFVNEEIAHAAVRPRGGLHRLQRAARLGHGADAVVEGLGEEGGIELEDRAADRVLVADAEEPRVGLAQEDDAPFLVGHPGRHGCVAQEGLEALLAAAERLGGHLGLGEEVLLAQETLAALAHSAHADSGAGRQRPRRDRLDQEVAGPGLQARAAALLIVRSTEQENGKAAGTRIVLDPPQEIEAPLLHPREHHVGPALPEKGLARRREIHPADSFESARQALPFRGLGLHPEKAVVAG